MSEMYYVVRETAVTTGRFFHFFDRANYGEPQFGDMVGAKRYKTLAACSARLRSMRAEGYSVIAVPVLSKAAPKGEESKNG